VEIVPGDLHASKSFHPATHVFAFSTDVRFFRQLTALAACTLSVKALIVVPVNNSYMLSFGLVDFHGQAVEWTEKAGIVKKDKFKPCDTAIRISTQMSGSGGVYSTYIVSLSTSRRLKMLNCCIDSLRHEADLAANEKSPNQDLQLAQCLRTSAKQLESRCKFLQKLDMNNACDDATSCLDEVVRRSHQPRTKVTGESKRRKVSFVGRYVG
jgi:hypothetical protein